MVCWLCLLIVIFKLLSFIYDVVYFNILLHSFIIIIHKHCWILSHLLCILRWCFSTCYSWLINWSIELLIDLIKLTFQISSSSLYTPLLSNICSKTIRNITIFISIIFYMLYSFIVIGWIHPSYLGHSLRSIKVGW